MCYKILDWIAPALSMQRFSAATPQVNQPIIVLQALAHPEVKSIKELTFVYGITAHWYNYQDETDSIYGSSLSASLLPSALREKLATIPQQEVLLVNPKLEHLCFEEEKGIILLTSLRDAYWALPENLPEAWAGDSVAELVDITKPKVRSALVWNGNTFKF